MHNRREFLFRTSGFLGISAFKLSRNYQAKLSFSTLGCPRWDFNKILEQAVLHQYQGIELRGILGQLDLTQINLFTPQNIPVTRRKISDSGIQIVNVGSSANLHFIDVQKRQNNLNEAKKFIDLAEQLNCPFIRVFPNDLPADQKDSDTLDAISSALEILGNHASGSQVKVLLESHGKVIRAQQLFQIMQQANHSRVGLVWDFFNMWSVTKEPIQDVYQLLHPYILHTHVKDAILTENGESYTLLGHGNAPVKSAIQALQNGNYQGYFSFEWEKLWHPEIAEPEIAIPHFATNFSKFLAS